MKISPIWGEPPIPLARLALRLESGEVLLVTMLDRLGRASRDLLNTLAAITGKEAAF